jgi:endoglucanase
VVSWYLIEDALDSGPKSIGFPDANPCDGSLSFPDLGEAPYNGSTPIIIYDAACGVPLTPPKSKGGQLGTRARAGDDIDRLEVARPSDPSDPYLRSWTKTLPGPIKFEGGSPPCAFPSRVWKSATAAKPTWNMLCDIHGGDSWSRFTSTTPTLMEWKLADKTFTIPPVGGYDSVEGGEMFLLIPNPLPGGNTHMISGQNPKNSGFYLGNYSTEKEKMTLDMKLGPQTIEWGFVDRWAVANYIGDGRLVTIGWLRRPDTLHAPCASPIPNVPKSENRFGGCENSVASLVRELLLDHATGQLISRPIAEYANLHTKAFVDQQLVPLLAVNGSATTLPIPPGQGGSLDVEVSFDLSLLTAGSAGEFGVALRSPNNSLSAALTLYFNASAPDAHGTRMVHVRTTQRLNPSVPSAPLPLLPVLKGERLTVRALIDRPYIEVFLQGGRIAFVVSPAFDPSMTDVRLFNGFHCPPGTEPSTAGCMPPPPKPRCTYHTNMQLYDPGSKHTLSPVSVADEADCCVQCMESAACYGAELYGGSCYLKTAKLPLVKQIPPKGVALVACVKNQSLGLSHAHTHAHAEQQQPPTVPTKLVANVTVHGMGCGWATNLPKPRLKTDEGSKVTRGATWGASWGASLAMTQSLGVPLKRGWNLGNTLEGCSPSKNPNGEWVFETVAAAGFDWVRIPAQWGCHAALDPPYTVDAAFLAQVNQTVGWALKTKMRAMINTHHENKWIDTTNTTTFNTALPRLVAIWTQIAEAFAGFSDDVLVFELFNEPNSMKVGQLNQMNAALLPAVRATNPTRQVHLGGLANMNSGWILSHEDAMVFPKADKHLALTVHSYDPWSFAGSSGPPPTHAPTAHSFDSSEYGKVMRGLKAWSVKHNIPVYLDECGCTVMQTNRTGRLEYYRVLRVAAEEAGVGWAIWDDDGWWKTLDRRGNRTWDSGVLTALGLHAPAAVVPADTQTHAESHLKTDDDAAGGTTVVVRVKDGLLVAGGGWVGTHTSQLTANALKLFPAVSKADWENTSMIDSSVLRYLVLDGDYLADVPLKIPSLFVLQLAPTATLKPAANLSLANISRFTALVEMADVHFSAVVGGTIDASSLPPVPGSRGYEAVAIKGGGNNAIRHLHARANNSDSALGVNMSPHAEIAFCDVGGGPGGKGMTNGRCIWALATSHALVHDNWVRNCSSHSLDFDAYTSASAAYNNLCEDGRGEGIFVEETASGNFIFNNTLRRNGCGIGVYANAVGPVANNMFIGNLAEDNRGNAITAGGYGHNPNKVSSGNIFASNVAKNNLGHDGGQFNVHHGANVGDLWTDNTVTGATEAYGRMPHNASMVVVFDPSPLKTDDSNNARNDHALTSTSTSITSWEFQ